MRTVSSRDVLHPWPGGSGYRSCQIRSTRVASDPARTFPRKEVIQPQVPLRLPCYDFTPVAEPTVAGCFLLRGWRTIFG